MTHQSTSNFWERARDDPEAVSLVDENQEIWTAGQLHREANRVANGLRAFGVPDGSVVALLMRSTPQLIACVLGTSQVGMYVVTLNPALAATELLYILNDSGANVLIVDETLIAAGTLNEMTHRRSWRCISVGPLFAETCYASIFGDASSEVPLQRSGGAILSYTSGTTGRPKGVLRPVGKVAPESVLEPRVRWYVNAYSIDPAARGVYLSCCPAFFAGPMHSILYSLHLGHVVVLMARWHPRSALYLIQKYRVTHTFMVPFHFHTLLRLPDSVRQEYDVTSIQCLVHGGAPCPLEIKRAMLDWLGECLFESYGSTEVGNTVASSSDWRRYPGTVGRPTRWHEVKILDDRGSEVPPGREGRVFLRVSELNDFVYKDDPQKTAACRVGDFVTVGDVGYLNAAGYLFLCDRREDLILCRGENIYPAEVEGALASHPNVVDCGCFGIPHEEWGQAVGIAVQWDNGSLIEEEVRESIRDYLRARLSLGKMPTLIQLVARIPRDLNGKLRRFELRSVAATTNA